MSQMENILFLLGKIDPKFRLYIKKISRKATSLSKRVIWEKKKIYIYIYIYLRIGQKDKNDKQSFYGVRVRGVTILESFIIWRL